jgi:hypothetical protein
MKRCVLFLLVASFLLSAASASADEPGEHTSRAGQLGRPGVIVLGVERFSGFDYAKDSNDSKGYTSFSLLGGSGLELGVAPYSIPRFGLDGFVSQGVSLGLSAHFATISHDSSSAKVFGLSPRVGYEVSLGDSFAFWPRAGISYLNITSEGQDSAAYLLAATLEALFVASPAPHFGITFGPTADIGMGGSGNSKVSQYGVQAGFVGWF